MFVLLFQKFDAISENGYILAQAYPGNNGLHAKRLLVGLKRSQNDDHLGGRCRPSLNPIFSIFRRITVKPGFDSTWHEDMPRHDLHSAVRDQWNAECG